MQNLIENTSKQNKKDDEDGEEKKKRPVIKTATDLQRLKLEKLMKNPDKPIIIPEGPREKDYLQTVPSFVRNVMGSSAGAGSGEFHVYRHLRRKEYARQKCIQAKSMREQLDEEYQVKLEKNRLESECKTAKKRAKRLKKKQQAKKPKTPRSENNDQEENEKQSTSEDDDEKEEEDENCTQEEESQEIAKCDSKPEQKIQVEDNDGETSQDIEGSGTLSTEETSITTKDHRPKQNEETSIEKVEEVHEEDQMKNETIKDGESVELTSTDKDIPKDVSQDLNDKETTIEEQEAQP